VQHPILILGRGGPIAGAQRQLQYLVTGTDGRRFALKVALEAPGALYDLLHARAVDVHLFRMSPWRSIFHYHRRRIDAQRLLKFARAQNVRLVHAQDVWRAEYARYIARDLGVPYVVHVRGPLSVRDVAKHRLALADTVITIARRYVDDLTAAGLDVSRIALIDDSVDLALFNSAQVEPKFIRKRFGIDGSPLVGLVGRIHPFKRVREFLEIVAMLPETADSNPRFLVVGDWDDEAYRRKLKQVVDQLQLGDRVRFVGGCSSDEMPSLLASLDLLVTMSGGSIMFEAMAMATPVLSVRTDNRHSEHTRHGKTAWCITADRPQPAVDALACVLQDVPLRRRLGDAGQAHVMTHLASSTLVAETEALYESLLAE
jgi:glycosyltransferase involved in cell wall biosynthesis